ncbi:hypothetical protein TanjilG_12493 [Lupinus angustifolius]|uniref:C2 NT-type domain-containing protein n=1 Tax=Lupinus angustifolius TaxID=3871 RepID=A0A4P1QYE3_LUPAN|nr:PREDICTED: uncharacterized protein LOC109326598 [Lupinus angustifolius]OIV97736.1 hypothetical protein TanjilG_12493 [Lupinus angustifolius]
MKWAPTLLAQKNKKHSVKLNELSLELGVSEAKVVSKNNKFAIEINGIGTRKGKPCTQTTSSRRIITTKVPFILWNSNDLYDFHLLIKDGSFDLAFHVLYGDCAKMTVVGKVSMSVVTAELLAGEEMKMVSNSHNLHRSLPIKLKLNGLFIQATLSVSLKLSKVGNSEDDPQGSFGNLVKSEKKGGFIGKVKFFTNLTKKNNGKFHQLSPYESDDSPVFDSDDSPNYSTTSSGSSNNSRRIIHNRGSRFNNRSERFMSSVHWNWPELSWNRSFRKWIFKTTTHSCPFKKPHDHELSPQFQDNNQGPSSRWEKKKIVSRDGLARVKTKVFFGSFDQRSEEASGESACTVLVALIAHWLHSNMDMPTRAEFDSLIRQGCSEWRRLCNNDYYLNLFPDKHFDLETIIEAKLRPLIVVPQRSYTGFFSPEKFQCLKGAMSFDEIWDEINNANMDDYIYNPRIYIVSWNDHFFVLNVEADAYYIIDSLGERLFEGCKQAFILKFDESSVMYGKVKKEEEFEIVCSGKECCKEFIKRFLATIPLGQLEKEENKGIVSIPYLHRQLQIDLHYSSSLSSSPSSSASSSSSLLSS